MTPQPLSSSPHVALITGSTSGIGYAIARALAQAGSHVVLNGFGNPKDIETSRQEIEGEYGVTCLYSPADMTKLSDIDNLIKGIQEKLGFVDIIVNNAGIQYVSPIESFPVEKWDNIISLNLSSAFHTSRLSFAGMKSRGWGRLIHIASAHSLVASPFKAAYVAAKHGLVGLSKTLALEGASFGITSNCISPGYVWTSLVEAQIPATMQARNMTKEQVINEVLLAAQPTRQFVTKEQVAALAVFLCSDAASQITGANLSMDGGWTAA